MAETSRPLRKFTCLPRLRSFTFAALTMDYHLHRDGQTLGIFSIEELRLKRQSGELSGAEFVWREGMTEWQPIDVLLQQGSVTAPSLPPPLPATKPSRRKAVIWASVACAVLALAGAGAIAWKTVKAFRQVQRAFNNSDGVEVAARKISVGTNSLTEADVRQQNGDFRRRVWLEGYRQNADRTRACDGEAIGMIEAWIEANFGTPSTNAPDIHAWCDKIAATPGCDDPLVLTVAGLNSIELHEQARRLQRALAAFPNSKHKGYPRFVALQTLIENPPDTNRIGALFREAQLALQECFKDGSIRPEDQAQIAEIFLHGWGYSFFYRVRQSVWSMPRRGAPEFEWLSLVLEGEFHVMEAWAARGGGYANTVTEKGWETFGKELANARGCFTRAWELRPDLPIAPTRMIYVAMGESRTDELRLWFDRAVAAQIDYPKAWDNIRWALRPRWHGSLEAMQALGKNAIDTGRFDTDVPRKFFDVVSDLESELQLSPGEHIYDRPDIWPDLARMYEGYIAHPSQQHLQGGWRSTYSVVAYLAGKYDVARTQLEALQWDPWRRSMGGWNTDLSLLPLEVAARTGNAGAKVSEAEEAFRSSRIDKALRAYEEVAAMPGLDSRTASFARTRVAALKAEKQLAAGEWIDFSPASTNDVTWVTVAGQVQRAGAGATDVFADKFGHMLYSRARVGTNFEVRGEFEVVKSSTEDFQAGLVFGAPSSEAMNWLSFRMKRNRDEGQIASFAHGWGKQQVAKPVSLSPTRNSFEFQFQNGRATAWVNGTRVMQNAALPKSSARLPLGEFYVGLGAFNDMNDTVIRYHKVQLRRLTPMREAQQ